MMTRPAAEIKAAWTAAGLALPESADGKAANMADWLESRLHAMWTQLADDLFGSGQLTRPERIALSGLIGDALEVFHAGLQDAVLAGVRERSPWEEAENVSPDEEPGRGAENARSAKDGRADSGTGSVGDRPEQDGDGDAGNGSAREIEFELERVALLEV